MMMLTVKLVDDGSVLDPRLRWLKHWETMKDTRFIYYTDDVINADSDLQRWSNAMLTLMIVQADDDSDGCTFYNDDVNSEHGSVTAYQLMIKVYVGSDNDNDPVIIQFMIVICYDDGEGHTDPRLSWQ